MDKILLSGYYGFNNLGDEAILEAIVNNLRTIDDIEITVLSANPEVTSSKYNVKSVDRKSITGIIKAIFDCKLLISGGGSLLQDVTSKWSIYYYLGIIFLGLLMGKKVMVYSQGIGPINNGFNRKITSILLNKVDYITVRDNESKEDLTNMGVSEEKIEVTADPVISIEKAGKETGRSILSKYLNFDCRGLIGFSLRGKNFDERFSKAITEVVEDLHERGLKAVFLTFHYNEDVNLMTDLEDKLKDKAVFIRDRLEVREILSIIENLDLLVGVRLHSLIFAAVAGIPMIGISYDPKIDYFMASMDLKSLCTVEDFSKDKLMEKIEEILENKDEISRSIQDNVEKLKKAVTVNESMVRKLLR